MYNMILMNLMDVINMMYMMNSMTGLGQRLKALELQVGRYNGPYLLEYSKYAKIGQQYEKYTKLALQKLC